VFEEVARQYLVFVIARGLAKSAVTELQAFTSSGPAVTAHIPQSQFLEFQNYSFRTDIREIDLQLRAKLQQISVYLGSLCCVNVGVVAHSRVGASRQFKKDDVVLNVPGKGRKPYVTGDNVDRYEIFWQGEFLDYEANRENFHRPKFPELFESPKVIVRRISGKDNQVIACIDNNNHYYSNDNLMHVVIWTPQLQKLQAPGSYEVLRDCAKYEIEFIGALLNSNLISKYFADFIATDTLQGSYTGVYPEDLRQLPVRRLGFTTPEKRRAGLVKEGITEALRWAEEKSQIPKSKTPTEAESFKAFGESKIGRWVAARLAAQPEEADCVHDLLAHLAGRMIEMNKEKQGEIKRFLAWLESALKISSGDKGKGRQGEKGIEALTGKSRLKNYLGDYQKGQEPLGYDELEDILFRNRGKLGVSVSDAKFTAKLRAEYEKSLAALLPLKQKLARTDRLIDWVVYGLYGLTEEEVRVVEGRQTNDNH